MDEKVYGVSEIEKMRPPDFRKIVRQNKWTEMTLNSCSGYAQANLVILPEEMAFEFLLFCLRNPKPCPVLDVTERGNPHPVLLAADADLRTDLGKYRVFREGELVDEPTDIIKYWRDDLIGFLIGCSLSFEWSLRANNIPYLLLGVYSTNIKCIPAGRFRGSVAVTCRLFKGSYNAIRAIQISSRYPGVHGAPLAVGNPTALGIKDLCQPDILSVAGPVIPPQEADEIALFWGCGVTPQVVARESKIPFMITHSPGYMFITDKFVEDFAVI